MALFDSKKNSGKKKRVENVKDSRGKLSTTLIAPWLSEKALIATERSVYTFAIPTEATKHDVMLAIEKAYNVVPKKVTIVNLPPKRVPLRTRRGFGARSIRRKAYVHLNKGDSIQFA